MNLQESIRADLNKMAETKDSDTETYYKVYVYGELVSDTGGLLTKEEADELVAEYKREGYSLSDIDVRKVEEDN